MAVDLPENIKDALSEKARELKGIGFKGSFPKRENYHITLKFLGEVEKDKLEDIKIALKEAVKGFSPFVVSIEGMGVFPAFKRPKVVWAGVKERGNLLERIFFRIEEELEKLGFKKEDKKFSPHITLTRVKWAADAEKRRIFELCSKEHFIGDLKVEKIALYESTLHPEGAIYKRLEEFYLGG